MGIDDESSHPELCSEVADGVTRTIVCLFREPDAGNPPVRFDEREQETESSQTGLRGHGESYVTHPPGGYRHCACSRLYSPLHSSFDYLRDLCLLNQRMRKMANVRTPRNQKKSARVRVVLASLLWNR